MQAIRRFAIAGAFLVGLASPLAGQDRGFVVQFLGGGYSHINNLNSAGTAHWNTGFAVAGAVGYQVNRYFGVHGDLGLARNRAIGVGTFTNQMFNRYTYGAHVEVRYPVSENVAPFVFAGGGAVTVDPRGATSFGQFTKPAGMFGAGMSFDIPNSRAALLLEAKALTYRWDRAEFNKTQLDVSYALGLAYTFR